MVMPLPPDLQQFANRQIASGKYASLEEILLARLQALAEQEQVYQGRFEELRLKYCLELKPPNGENSWMLRLKSKRFAKDYASATLKHESSLSNYTPRQSGY